MVDALLLIVLIVSSSESFFFSLLIAIVSISFFGIYNTFLFKLGKSVVRSCLAIFTILLGFIAFVVINSFSGNEIELIRLIASLAFFVSKTIYLLLCNQLLFFSFLLFLLIQTLVFLLFLRCIITKFILFFN